MPPRRVFVVEDDEDCLEATCAVLSGHGYDCASASNGLQALEHLRTSDPPALILLDLMLPVMDGWQFLEEIKKDARLSRIPIVLVSAERNLGEKAKSFGVAGALQKPFGMEMLLATIARVLP